MGGWGISENATPKEKLKSEMADYLHGLNSVGKIDYSVYCGAFDFSMELLDKMYDLAYREVKEEFIAKSKIIGRYLEEIPEGVKRIYLLKYGDTLSQVSKKFEVTLDELREINPHIFKDDVNKVYVNDVIYIPCSYIS